MYKCVECGYFFNEPDSWLDDRGEHFGTPCYEVEYGCPKCKGDYEEAAPCKICGELFVEDELNGGVCDECFDKYRYDLEMWLKIGENEKQSAKINSFVYGFFTDKEIEEILTREIVDAIKINPSVCGDLIDENRDWWGEKLAKEVME